MASASTVPSARVPACAERGMVRSAGSITTRIAATGTPAFRIYTGTGVTALTGLGLIEVRDEGPVLTQAGIAVLNG